MKITIYTTSKSDWYKNEATYVERAYAPYFPLTFDVVQIDVPSDPQFVLYKNGDKGLDWKWVTKTFPKVADGVGFHFGPVTAKKWRITLGGQRNSENKVYPEFWMTCSTRKAKWYPFSSFIRILFHELAHFWEDVDNETGNTLNQVSVHYWDYDLKKIHEYHTHVNFSRFKTDEVSKLKVLLASLVAKLKNLMPREKLLPRVERQAQEVLRSMELLGMPMRITEGYRSIARQNELYAQGRTKAGKIITNAKGGESLHNHGVAVDFVFRLGYDVPLSHWKTFGTIAVSKGFEWGGNWTGFVDKPHLEMKLGYTLQDFQLNKVDYNKYK